jgi:hypothetical protein
VSVAEPDLVLVRPTLYVRKFLIILAGVTVGAAVFAGGAFAILLLLTSDDVSINLKNNSGTQLHNIAVIIPNSPFSHSSPELSPGDEFDFSADRHTKLAMRVVFDAGGRHYNIPAEIRLPPVGDFVVIVGINESFQFVVIKTFLI